jgi:cell division protease FtsH
MRVFLIASLVTLGKCLLTDISNIQKYKGFFPKESVNQLFDELTNEKVSKIFIGRDYKEIVSIVKLPEFDMYSDYHLANVDPIIVPKIVEKAIEHHIDTSFIDFTSTSIFTNIQNIFGFGFQLLNYVVPIFLLVTILRSFFSGGSPMGGPSPMNMNQRGPGSGGFFSRNNMNEKDNVIQPNVSLSSWAGSPEVLEECREAISYLDNKEKFKLLGAEMPKGILLEGPPGTGKTLLAKGIATETNASFISISGSEFVELFVGIGASRVRDLFSNARNNRPCVIFIDEIDAVGRQRGTGINMANDEREQTLNQILYEMDGFNDNENILVLAATNRKDVLDQALLRPGRFDRIIRVPLPDKFSREKILDFYLKSRPVEKTLDINALAEITSGFSGAQLKNLINEAAIMSAKKGAICILEEDLFNAFEKLIVGLVKNNGDVSDATKTRVAIHESGHAFLTLVFKNYFELQKISIKATYNGAGGYTLFTEKAEIKEGGLYTKDILKKRLIVTMGGKAAENIYYGEEFVSLGAVEDLRQANKLAQQMIGNYGMGNKLEVFFNENVNDGDNPFLGRSLSTGSKYSENTKIMMDNETLSLVVEAYNEAKSILMKYKDKVSEMTELLKNKTTLNLKDLSPIIDDLVIDIL